MELVTNNGTLIRGAQLLANVILNHVVTRCSHYRMHE